jgi:uncharacterized RDD family membrane protein YckC
MPPPVPATPTYTARAGVFDRAAASGIDLLIAFMPIGMAYNFADGLLDRTVGESKTANYVLHVLRHLSIVGFTLMEVFKAATPGKMIMGLVIARHDGTPADRWTLALRWSTKQHGRLWVLLAAVILSPFALEFGEFMTALVTIGCLQALDEDRRTWHDQWSGTAVWKKPKVLPRQQRKRPDWLPPEIDGPWPSRPAA